MGFVDIFRKLWGWLSGESAQLVFAPKVIDRVNFLTPTDIDSLTHVLRDRVNFDTPTDEVDFTEG